MKTFRLVFIVEAETPEAAQAEFTRIFDDEMQADEIAVVEPDEE